MTRQSQTPHIVVLGAGVTGLSAAFELSERARRENRKISITVLESSSRVGGKIQTEIREGAIIEAGPDSFITTKPDALELITELGLGNELVKTNPGQKTVYVCVGGSLRALPDGMSFLPTRLLPFIFSDLLTWRAKARILAEPWVTARVGDEDESLASFARRRLGPDALELMVGPMLAGIYAGDAEQLSLQSTFPQLRDMELRGGLLKALWKARPQAQAADRTLFMSLRGGLSTLTEALARKLPAGTVKMGQPISALKRRGAQWIVHVPSGPIVADAVLSALPANVLSKIVSDLDLELSCVLAEIPFASTATVSTIYDQKGFPNKLDGFGFLVPKKEGRAITAATFTSTKFPGRAAEGQVLIRSFLGGVGRESAAEADDDSQIGRAARHDLRDLLNLGELHPKITRSFRFPKANPQYTIGHSLRLSRIASCLQGLPNLALAGCSYQGVGLPDCIRSGRQAAVKLLRGLSSRAPAGVS